VKLHDAVIILAVDDDALFMVRVDEPADGGDCQVHVIRRSLMAERATMEVTSVERRLESEGVHTNARRWTFSWPDGFRLSFRGIVAWSFQSGRTFGSGAPAPSDLFAIELARQLGWKNLRPLSVPGNLPRVLGGDGGPPVRTI
jgi:hypothetical protein